MKRDSVPHGRWRGAWNSRCDFLKTRRSPRIKTPSGFPTFLHNTDALVVDRLDSCRIVQNDRGGALQQTDERSCSCVGRSVLEAERVRVFEAIPNVHKWAVVSPFPAGRCPIGRA